jgi:hypothetical protein
MIAPRPPTPSLGRLIDVWSGGTDRDPETVVAEHRNRAPPWLRSEIRPLTKAERRLWRYLGDPAWMRTRVFTQVPLYLPEVDRGFVLPFLVPARGVAVDVVRMAPGDSLAGLARMKRQDHLALERAGITIMHLVEEGVLRDPQSIAESIRWTLGYDEGDGTFIGINLPRP